MDETEVERVARLAREGINTLTVAMPPVVRVLLMCATVPPDSPWTEVRQVARVPSVGEVIAAQSGLPYGMRVVRVAHHTLPADATPESGHIWALVYCEAL